MVEMTLTDIWTLIYTVAMVACFVKGFGTGAMR